MENSKVVIDECRNFGMTWQQIADKLGVNCKSLFNWRKDVQYVDPFKIKAEQSSKMDAIEIKEKVDELRKLRYNWQSIADALGHNKKWLDRWRRTNNYIDPLIQVSGESLDNILGSYCLNHIENGRNVIMSKLESLGYRLVNRI